MFIYICLVCWMLRCTNKGIRRAANELTDKLEYTIYWTVQSVFTSLLPPSSQSPHCCVRKHPWWWCLSLPPTRAGPQVAGTGGKSVLITTGGV